MRRKTVWAMALVAAAALALSGCSGSNTSNSSDGKKVTIDWWTIQNTDPMKTVWKNAADDYMKAHPDVTIKTTVQSGDPFKTALNAKMQAGDPPDLFQTWGGGVLASQVKAGMVKNITDDVKPWVGNLSPASVNIQQVNGKQYAIPYQAGLVGVWYNKALFKAAGITSVPTTWPEFMKDVKALRDSGTIPIALGESDKFTGMFWWAELALKEGGQAALTKAGKTGSFNAPAFVKAGEKIVDLVKANAFENGFVGIKSGGPTGATALIANGKAAMNLGGSWQGATMVSVAANGKGPGSDLGWFPFPTIPGGKGGADAGFGGSNGFAVGKNAPPETLEFLKYLSSLKVQKKVGATQSLLPVAKGSEETVTDPNLQKIVTTLAKMKTLQNFLDQAYAPAVSNGINDHVQAIFAGTASPKAAADAIATIAEQQQ